MKCGDTDEVRPSDFTRFFQSDRTFTTNYLFDTNNNASTIYSTGFIQNVNSEIIESMELSSKTTTNSENIHITTKPLNTYLITNQKVPMPQITTSDHRPKTDNYDSTKSIILSTCN